MISAFSHFESLPTVYISLAEALDNVEQRPGIPTVHCVKSWPSESVSVKTIFYTTKFGVVCYTAVVIGTYA